MLKSYHGASSHHSSYAAKFRTGWQSVGALCVGVWVVNGVTHLLAFGAVLNDWFSVAGTEGDGSSVQFSKVYTT